MPDISGAAPAVQTQLRDAYATLQQRTAGSATPDERASAYGEMGRLFFATEYFDSAETCFLNAQALEPNDARWPYFLAHIQRRRNDPGKAATLFERVLALDPDNVPALVWLGDMRLVEGRPDAAEAPLARALTLAPRDAAAVATTRVRSTTSRPRSNSSHRHRACTIRSRSPIAALATRATLTRSSGFEVTSTSRRSTR
jgi:tetratricopeptide (TPR) repeat protein